MHGFRSTRSTLGSWNRRLWPVLGAWVAGSLPAAILLLCAVWVIAARSVGGGPISLRRRPFQVGDQLDVLRILIRNSLVLALHALACVASFIAGSSLPPSGSAPQRPRAPDS